MMDQTKSFIEEKLIITGYKYAISYNGNVQYFLDIGNALLFANLLQGLTNPIHIKWYDTSLGWIVLQTLG